MDRLLVQTPPVEANAYLKGWLNGATCEGTVKIMERADASRAAALGLHGAPAPGVNGTLPVPNPNLDPATVTLAMLALTVIATATALAAVLLAQANEKRDPVAKWEYSCTALGYGVEANGDGGVLRRVSIEAPAAGVPTEVGSSCEYDGVLATTCPVPATFRNDAAQPVGGNSGFSEIIKNEQKGRLEFSPPLDVEDDVCINPEVRAVNAFQYANPFVDVGPLRAKYGVLPGSLCSSACIVWVELVGCHPADAD